MEKKKINTLELSKKYLSSIGISKQTLDLQFLPSRFEPVSYCVSLKKSNIVQKNKANLGSNETHIAIAKSSWALFYSNIDISLYENTGNTCEKKQRILFYEANINSMLKRRSNSKSSYLSSVMPKSSYRLSDELLEGSTCTWISSNKGETQVRLSKVAIDSDTFNDFRLGIQINDYLIFLKAKFDDYILAISIPYEFAQKYIITKSTNIITPHRYEVTSDTSQLQDLAYQHETYKSAIAIETPLLPSPAPKPRRKEKNKPRYIAAPSIGKGAIQKAQYKCELEIEHSTFKSRKTNMPFMEPHHLIPISKQYLFENNIDITANIISLCPNCHSKIHYGQSDEVKEILQKLFDKRKNALIECGISIDIETLFSLYDL